MNLVLLVIDSLRADAITPQRTPFLTRLAQQCTTFTRAYSAECWTLPSHCSMFTGLLPSEHQAHFQNMQYAGKQATIAELLSRAGYYTELVTRNSIFDGSIPGINRGFQKNTRVAASRSGLNPLSLLLALSKPRFRRQIRRSGFFNAAQRINRDFVGEFAQATIPADVQALKHVANTMRTCKQPYFIFANLYDVHAPYAPSLDSIFRPLNKPSSWYETLRMPFVLPKLGAHAYLREGFRMSSRDQELLLNRYHDAVALMDAKLKTFYYNVADLLEDTLLIITSDHGEAFGEHGLYLHDASVFEENLHVPLLIRYVDVIPTTVHDVVSTRDLFGVMKGIITGMPGTILDPIFRDAHPFAVAEHFHSPKISNPKYCGNLRATITEYNYNIFFYPTASKEALK